MNTIIIYSVAGLLTVLALGFTIAQPRRFINVIISILALVMWLYIIGDSIGSASAVYWRLVIMIGLIILPLTIIGSAIFKLYYEYASRKKPVGMLKSLLFLLIVAVVSVAVWAAVWYKYRNIEYSHFMAYKHFMTNVDYALDFIFMLIWIVAITIAFSFAGFCLYSKMHMIMPKGKKYGYIIVHGDGVQQGGKISDSLQEYLDKAIEVYQKCCEPTAKFVASGMQIRLMEKSEAVIIKDYLMSKGIPQDRIMTEELSHNVGTTLRLSILQILKNEERQKVRAIIFTDEYYMFRMNLYASKMKMDIKSVAMRDDSGNTTMQYLREYVIAAYYYRFFLAGWMTVAIAGIVMMLL